MTWGEIKHDVWKPGLLCKPGFYMDFSAGDCPPNLVWYRQSKYPREWNQSFFFFSIGG